MLVSRLNFLLDLASAECGSQGAGQQVGLCIVSSQATIREELLLEMETAGARLSFTPA